MKNPKIYYKIGAWAFIILGVGHSLAHILSNFVQKTEEQMALITSMEQFPINLLGSESNMFNFHNGFSLIMGIFIFSYGLINLLFLHSNVDNRQSLRPIAFLNSAVAAIVCGLSIQLFFIVPTALTGIACLAFGLAFFVKIKENTIA